MIEFVKRIAADRISGGRLGAPRALGAATAAGTAAAAFTYRVVRH
jgi:hypothetical protein